MHQSLNLCSNLYALTSPHLKHGYGTGAALHVHACIVPRRAAWPAERLTRAHARYDASTYALASARAKRDTCRSILQFQLQRLTQF